jgi:hypothetical protein
MRHHLAQVNIARSHAPFADASMASLVERIAEINALAERSKGFVWRFKAPEDGSRWFAPFEDYFVPFAQERFFFNMSVWESIEDLKHYVFRTAHSELLKGRQHWMGEFEKAALAMWWIRAGHVPTVAEARAKLEQVQQLGPTSDAFTLATVFPKPDG